MVTPTLYKKISTAEVENRNTVSLTQAEKTKVNEVVSKFFELFKDKHL
jgi:hypothetical protein